MVATFGLDFGTTNSLISVIRLDGETDRFEPSSYLIDGRPHPSVIWYPGDQPVVGRKAMDQLTEFGLGVFGDIVRSPKMFLGSSTGIYVGGVSRRTADVVSDVLLHLRQDALGRGYGDNPFSCGVVTIPVTMGGLARAELRQAAQQAGMRIHQFIHEPLAALYGHLRSRLNFQQEIANLERKLVLVFDWGGGTLDLTLCQIQGGILAQIRNLGDREVGGDQFDFRLRQLVRQKHEEQYPGLDWSNLQPSGEARLIHACEDAKIALSSRTSSTVFVRNLLASSGPEKDLYVQVNRSEFQAQVHDLVSKGLGRIKSLLEQARVPRGAIEFCLATGGMIEMPAITDGLREIFGMSQLRLTKNAATVISEGAAWIAHDRVGLQLAKPIELLHADNSYVEIFPSGTDLPTDGDSLTQTIDMYCVDTSDGMAKFLFARPAWPTRESEGDDRIPYTHLTLPVDQRSRPFNERLRVDITIDHNLIAEINAYSLGRRQRRRASVYALEFGLSISRTSDSN